MLVRVLVVGIDFRVMNRQDGSLKRVVSADNPDIGYASTDDVLLTS
jgi:hypothetical protein